MRPEHALAIHEAGHAVVWARLRVEYRTVELLVDDPLGRGGAVFGPLTSLGSRERYLAGLLAGSIAEAQFTGRDLADIAAGCGAIDFTTAASISGDMTEWQRDANLHRATRLVTRNAWPISLVAAALIEQRALTQSDVLHIIREGGRRDLAAA